ncbi:voltage-dependent calcium channel subunit alpha-2/delta-3-like [Spodoptera litura]|uniref:Voltage-dependent calcium channel subunit alpha-2/delta-3-like n=1 Tax=Spodoptera litura TaxID=69820 RepID=A0A9J7IR16_SPOLT|nr:voltage-dependent calcium channel subunit alpha-2/delta-3-like [Spodoptera litura]
MKINFIVLIFFVHYSQTVKIKSKNGTINKSDDAIKKYLEKHEEVLLEVTKNKSEVKPVTITDVVNAKIVPVAAKKAKAPPKMIPPDIIQDWANEISQKLYENEAIVVRREVLLKSFSDIKIKIRNGTAIVHKMAEDLEELLSRRAHAAEEIMRRAEELATMEAEPDDSYTFDYSVDLDKVKKKIEQSDLEENQEPLSCRNLRKIKLKNSKHFDADVSLDYSSVHVSAEVFDCAPNVKEHLFWSEGLLSTFQKNYAQDSSMDFQYFCSAQGFLRHYPAALWESMYKLKYTEKDSDKVYDCRLRPWYVSAGGAPRDVLILLDASGSMENSSNQVIAEQFTLALLSALTDDDRVNVLRFNVIIESPISCFNEKLVSANHVNTAAMMAAMNNYKMTNETLMADVLESATRLLQRQRSTPDRPKACQQAIVLLTDSLYDNYTHLMKHLDPGGNIRVFVLWLHDVFGLRDNTRTYGEGLSCERDGYFAELITPFDVTQQVLKILQVLERPLVSQRNQRLTVFSDVYAHVEDPRRGELYWKAKENKEQLNRYKDLRRNKKQLLNSTQLYKDWMYQVNYNRYGHYYEGEDLNYRLQISVSVPVFDYITSENITKKLDEEKQRNSTRTYPVNRLLGVAGVDIPIDHLKLILPYHQIGAGGSLILADHRGNIVIHDNVRHTFDGDILKPGYRTVDLLDLEQPAENHKPRYYPQDWVKFRRTLIIDKDSGNVTMYGKGIYDDGMRAILENRQYYWKRVLNHYTAIVVLPLNNRVHAVPDARFTKELAAEAWKSLSRTDYAVNPDWLYCRHIEPHFETREAEVRHFVKRRSDEANFPMQKLKYLFSPIPPSLFEKTYQCNEDLMAKFCKEAIATDQWAREHEEPDTERDCSTCELGSTTAFFASESGLTRWQQYHATSAHALPPSGSWWPRGPAESWYRRAAASPDTLIIHAPVEPIGKMRVSKTRPPPYTIRSEWLTAARTLGSAEHGIIGVAGYHFHPQHLIDLLESVTNFPCPECEDYRARCDGVTWSCVLIDEYGWIVAREGRNLTEEPDEPLREHFASVFPMAMKALLNASVFEMNWIHDYQGVCFPPEDEPLNSAMTLMPSILRSLWRSVGIILRVTQEMITLIAVLSSSCVTLVSGDTEQEKQKRKKRLWRDYEREKYETLYDDRVLVNRTRFAACDRSRVLYLLQNTTTAQKALKRPPQPCSWPLVAARVPKTNLLLVAVYNNCPFRGKPVNDPLINEQYLEVDPDVKGFRQSSASKLACWRNRVPLPSRPPHVKCYQHNYAREAGYRQCGPWLPDPEEEDAASNITTSKTMLAIILIMFLIKQLQQQL